MKKPDASSRSTEAQPIRSVMLLLKFPPHFAGGGLQASRLMEQLAARGVEVTTLTSLHPESSAATHEHAFGGVVRRFKGPRSLSMRNLLLGIQAGLWLALRHDWDVLHIHGYSHFAVIPIAVARLKKRPILIKTTILWEDGAFRSSRNPLARRLLEAYRLANRIVALSEEIRSDLLRRPGMRVPVLYVPNGVDTDAFRPATAEEREATRSAIGVPDTSMMIFACGELSSRKNFIQIVRAMARMDEHPVALVIAGPKGEESPYLDELSAEIAALGSHHSVRMLGRVASSEVAHFLRAADVFVLPSRAEGMPNAVLEAIASGVACVATDIPGSRDVLGDGGGQLVPLDDPDSLADVLDRLAADPDWRARWATAARTLAESSYSFDVIARRYLEIYEDLTHHPAVAADR